MNESELENELRGSIACRSCRDGAAPVCRPRRDLPLANGGVETLEVRSLLSSAAVIAWSMVPQIAPDPLHGNEPDLPNTAAYVNPPDGYGVRLDASHSVGIQPSTTFSWTVTDSLGHTTPLSGEDPRIDLPQGPYTVQLTATGLLGSTGRSTPRPTSRSRMSSSSRSATLMPRARGTRSSPTRSTRSGPIRPTPP